MGDDNPRLQDLGPLGKFAMGFNPTRLKVEVSPRLCMI
jgi:hypothetical protein